MPDAIVIGAGPVGSRVAHRLAEKGHSVVVLERRPKVGAKACCTGIVSQECARAFDISGSVVLATANCASLFSPSGNRLRLQREEAQACILDRAALDEMMAARARGAGAEYVLGSLASGVSIEKHEVKVRVSRASGDTDFEGRAVVVASGFGFGLTDRLGLGRVGDFTSGAQAEVATAGLDETEVYFGQDVAPGFFAWLVPTSSHTARFGLLARRSPGACLRKLASALLARGKIISDSMKVSYGGVPLQPLPRTYADRLIVVGDAAGQVKPTTGGGIYYGLLCADVAADTLHEALETDDLSAARLAGYERRWRQRLGHELRVDHWARRLFERLSDEQIDRAFKIVQERGIDHVLLSARELSFDWHSQAIVKLMGYQLMSRAVGVVKFPFRR